MLNVSVNVKIAPVFLIIVSLRKVLGGQGSLKATPFTEIR